MSVDQSPSWQKSTYSAEGGNCLEVAISSDARPLLRESDEPNTVLTTTPDRLRGLLALARQVA